MKTWSRWMGPVARIAVQRMRANGRWVAAVAVGIFAAATLLAAAPIYHRAMNDLGIRSAVVRDLGSGVPPPEAANVPLEPKEREVVLARVEFARVPVGGAEASSFRSETEARIGEHTDWLATRRQTYTRVSFIATKDAAPERPFAEAYLQSLPGWEDHVQVIDGRLPQTGTGGPLEVVVSERGALLAGLKPGDAMALTVTCDEGDEACRAAQRQTTAQVVGIVAPTWEEDPYWASGWPTYLEPAYVDSNPGLILPILASPGAFGATLDALDPGLRGYSAWYVYTLPARLSRGNIDRALSEIGVLDREVSGDQGVAFSPLRYVISQFQRQSDHQRGPLTILLLELSAIALFYIVLVGSAVMDRQGREIALLRSRGTSTAQVVASHVVEAVIIGVAATVAAPLLAAGIIAFLGVTPVFDEVSDGARLPVTLLPSAFGLAALGAFLGVCAVVVPAWVAARRALVSQRQAEARPSRPFFQRFYLDIAFAGIAALLLWELSERGSVYTPSPTGGVSTDPLLLASPALLVFAVALLFLRLYPLALRALGWVLSKGPGTSGSMALAYLVRRPGQYGQLALLLLMAVAVGTFAASYTSTTDRSLEDRAAFESGVTFRAHSGVGAGHLGSNGPQADAELEQVDGIARASAVLRTSGDVSLTGDRGRTVQLLALDAPVAEEMLWFRDDFADSSLAALLKPLERSSADRGIELPGSPVTFSAWVNTPEEREFATVWATFEDSLGTTVHSDLGSLNFKGWQELSTPVGGRFGVELAPPIRLTGLLITSPPTRGFTTADAGLLFDDFAVTGADGVTTVVEDFEAPILRWEPLVNSVVNPDGLEATDTDAHGGRRSAKLVLAGGSSPAMRGIYPADQRIPLAVAASEDALAGLGLVPGGRAVLRVGDVPVPVVVRSVYRRFPTLPTADGPSLVLARDELNAWLRTWAITSRPQMNEAWLDLEPGADKAALATRLSDDDFGLPRVVDREALLAAIDQDPLIAAGGTGLLTIGFVATLILLGGAALVVLFTGAERRRSELAVLRAMGFSQGQVARMVALEYGLLVVLGIVLGALLGRELGTRMLSFLNVTETGARVEPEFILTTDWAVVAMAAGGIVLAFALTLALVLMVSGRSPAGQALRQE